VIAGLGAAVTGRRGRWLTIAVWVVLGVGGWIGRSQIGDVTSAGVTSFLPKGSESTRALEALYHRRGPRGGARGCRRPQ
jgi:hypothetical protein